ncbi:MAG TPA: hypothetical protein VMW53_00070 [archaeon]|nr:hypothetical protein [archaeon]
MRRRDGCFGECKFLKKETPSIHPPADLITDLDEFKQRLSIKSRAKTLSDLIKYLDPPRTVLEREQNLPLQLRQDPDRRHL